MSLIARGALVLIGAAAAVLTATSVASAGTPTPAQTRNANVGMECVHHNGKWSCDAAYLYPYATECTPGACGSLAVSGTTARVTLKKRETICYVSVKTSERSKHDRTFTVPHRAHSFSLTGHGKIGEVDVFAANPKYHHKRGAGTHC